MDDLVRRPMRPELVEDQFALDLFLNQVFQSVRTIDEGVALLAELDGDQRRAFWTDMHMAVYQVHPSSKHVERAIVASSLKPTYTPCVLARKYLTDHATSSQQSTGLHRIIGLPGEEETKTFILFVHLFREADADKRTQCGIYGCSHWWHRDLGDREVVHQIAASRGCS